MVEFTWPSDAIKQSARQVGIPSYAGGRRRAKPLLQYSKKHWMKELGDGCWHASPKPPDAQRAGGICLRPSQRGLIITPGGIRQVSKLV